MDANQCRSMCDLQRLSRTTFLHISLPLSSKRNWIVGRHCLLCKSVAVLAGHLCEFHTKWWGEPCSVPVGCLPHAFVQLIVCKGAVDCLKSLRAALLSQDCWQEGTFALTHTLFLTCTSLVWISYQTVRGALLCSCQLFAPHFSAIDSLQECSWLFEELKGSAAFTRLVVGRCLCMHPYFVSHLYFLVLVAVLDGHLCEFHTKQWGEPCCVPVSCLPHTFLQLTVCRSVDCQVFEELKGGTTFAGWAAEKQGTLPYFLLTLLLFLYHTQQHDHEGLLFYVEEFSNATMSCRFAH